MRYDKVCSCQRCEVKVLSSVGWMALLNPLVPLMYAQEQDRAKVRSSCPWEWSCFSKVLKIVMVTGSFGFLGKINCFTSSVLNTGNLFSPFLGC